MKKRLMTLGLDKYYYSLSTIYRCQNLNKTDTNTQGYLSRKEVPKINRWKLEIFQVNKDLFVCLLLTSTSFKNVSRPNYNINPDSIIFMRSLNEWHMHN